METVPVAIWTHTCVQKAANPQQARPQRPGCSEGTDPDPMAHKEVAVP